MNFLEVMFYENYLTLDFHTKTVTSRRVYLLVKMASNRDKAYIRLHDQSSRQKGSSPYRGVLRKLI